MGSLLRRIILLSLGIGFGLALSALLTSRAQALTVSALQSDAAVGQPLQLQLAVTDLVPGEPLAVRIADPADHARYGLARPDWADALRFTVESTGDGRARVLIRGDHSPAQAQLPLVLEFARPGRLRVQQLRFLLPAAPSAADARPAPPVPSFPIEVPQPIVETAGRPAATTLIPVQGDAITVASGDTLLQLAQQWSQAGLTLEQRARMLFDANPQAFIADDPNRLRRGARVYWPEPGQPEPTAEAARRWLADPLADADAASAAAAPAAVRLMVVAEEESGLGATDPALDGESEAALQQRLQSLRQQRADLLQRAQLLAEEAQALDQRLSITDERLAALERQLNQTPEPIEITLGTMPEAVAQDLLTPAPAVAPEPVPEASRLPGHTLFAWFMVALLAVFLLLMNLFSRLRRRPAPVAASGSAAVTSDPPADAAPAATPAPVAVPVAVDAPGAAGAGRVAPTLGEDDDEYDFMTDAQAEAQQTRLDLAQAYVEMGQPENARQLLAVVLTQGSAAQREQAQHLLDQLG